MAHQDTADELQFMLEDDEAEQGPAPGQSRNWCVLIVDDDPDVHTTTTFALRGVRILGRELTFLHASSAREACALFDSRRDIAVVLLDVVMEEEDAGLKLVATIRQHYRMLDTRIVLRTGQPGYAPELEAIRDYDINDYKTKSELTRNKLFTTLTTAIRSYDQIRTIEASRRGLDMVVHASGELLALTGMRNFAAGVITQISALLGVSPEGLICAQHNPETGDECVVIAAAGRYSSFINQPLARLEQAHIRDCLLRCLASGRHLYELEGTCLFFGARDNQHMAAYLDTRVPVDADMQRLLALFCSNIAIGLDNTLLFSQLHQQAFCDPLTGLPNRLDLTHALSERLGAPDRLRHSLVLIDVDNFADTNDALGHEFGDQLLRAVAQRLRERLAEGCLLARVSGDTFGVLGPIERLLPNSLSGIFREPFLVDGQDLMVSVTMGIAHLADTDGSGADALKDAGLALRRAKQHARGEYSFFSRDMAVAIRERARLLQALRVALERQHMFLMYQPLLSLHDGRVIGLEALLRWRGEEGALIEPARFIPIAEHSGMIVGIGEWVTRMACFQQAELARQGFGELRMSINVSVAQFRHPRFLASLRAALEDSGAQPASIELEITESVAMEETDFMHRIIGNVRALGVGIAVDDFGTGFSSLAYLQRLHIDRLKIDRAFVAEIANDERTRRIPELIIQLGHRLGLKVLAEGVETAAQAETLRRLDCDEGQGWHWARPMEPPALIEWLRNPPRRD